MTHVKVCCIQNVEEARLAIELGAAALGLVSAMPSGPGVIPDDRIAEIAADVPDGVATFLLTAQVDPERIVDQQRRSGVDTLQLVDRVSPDTRQQLRNELPNVSIVQVIHVEGEGAVEEAMEVQAEVDALLLDSGRPGNAVRELGGTGRTHDWSVSRKICDVVDVPVYLAGGLRPENVSAAVREVKPYGVDLCSGVRTDGLLDPAKLERFMKAVREASR